MTATSEDSPRRRRGAINRRVILDASAAMFHEKGFDRTTLDDIAGMLSVTKPSLYYYFENKEDIFVGCILSAFEHFQAALAAHDEPAADGRRRVELFLRQYLEVVTQDIGVSVLLGDDRALSPATRALYDDHRRALNRGLVERLRQGVADGSIVASETKLTSFAILGMFNWVAHWDFRNDRASLDEIYARFSAILFDGIGTH